MIRKKLLQVLPLTILLVAPYVYAVPSNMRYEWQQDPSFSFEEGYIGALFGANRESTLDTTNVTAGITAGYGATYSHGYIGAELSSQPIAVTADLNKTTKVNTRNIINLDIIPGFYFTSDFLAYLRLGGGANYTKVSNTPGAFDENSVTFSVRAGLGVDWRVADQWGLGLDYIYNRNDISNVNKLPQNSPEALTNELVAAHLRYYFE